MGMKHKSILRTACLHNSFVVYVVNTQDRNFIKNIFISVSQDTVLMSVHLLPLGCGKHMSVYSLLSALHVLTLEMLEGPKNST